VKTLRTAMIGLAFGGLVSISPAVAYADAPQLVASLTGVQLPGQPPPPASARGTIHVWMGSDPGIICFELTVQNLPNIPAIADGGMHLVVAGRTYPTSIKTILSTACISGFNASVISDLFTNPGHYSAVVTDLNPDAAGCGAPSTPCILAEISGQFGFATTLSPAPGKVPNTAVAPYAPKRDAGELILLEGILAICGGAWLMIRRSVRTRS
jgi:hypothetical protein